MLVQLYAKMQLFVLHCKPKVNFVIIVRLILTPFVCFCMVLCMFYNTIFVQYDSNIYAVIIMNIVHNHALNTLSYNSIPIPNL